MQPEPDRPGECVRVEVTAHGWRGVQRIVVVLSGRGYAVRDLQARPTADEAYWQVRAVLRCPPAELVLLTTRLERIPSVTAVLTSSTAECGTPGEHR